MSPDRSQSLVVFTREPSPRLVQLESSVESWNTTWLYSGPPSIVKSTLVRSVLTASVSVTLEIWPRRARRNRCWPPTWLKAPATDSLPSGCSSIALTAPSASGLKPKSSDPFSSRRRGFAKGPVDARKGPADENAEPRGHQGIDLGKGVGRGKRAARSGETAGRLEKDRIDRALDRRREGAVGRSVGIQADQVAGPSRSTCDQDLPVGLDRDRIDRSREARGKRDVQVTTGKEAREEEREVALKAPFGWSAVKFPPMRMSPLPWSAIASTDGLAAA